ncbi:MAG: EAL domain-containing protein [Clostridia bacterium]|nr:EAL domain-containing protein [Clostridia bacterium]
MYVINLEIPAFLLSLLSFVFCLTANRRQYIPPKTLKSKFLSQHFVFLAMLMSNMLSSLSSVIGVYISEASFPGVAFWQYLFHAFYFFFHATLSVTFTLYIINVTGTGINWKKWMYFLFLLPYIVSEVIVLTNSFTSLAFYMDENLVYHRGPLMPLLYAFGGFYVILGFVFFFKNKKAISKADSIAVGVYIGIATVGLVFQAVFSKYLVELYCEALACLIIMIVLEVKTGHIDPSTGLLNRQAFIDTNRKMIASKQNYSVVLIRLTESETLTQKFGTREADAFFQEIASFIVKESEVNDIYCYSRGVFSVLFRDDAGSDAMIFADKTLSRFDVEWNVDSLKIRTDAVVSLIRIPEDVDTFDALDSLLSTEYMKSRPGSYLISMKEIQELTKYSKYEESLRNAVRDQKLMVKYQPIWSAKEKRTTSAEALLRIDCDELRNVSPEVYIPIAEKTGLIKDIGLFVFEEVCRFMSDERAKNSGIQYVELNLSVYQFMFSDLVDSFERIRKSYGVDRSRINLEITETAATMDDREVLETLQELRKLGYGLSLDDFGTGYSNLVRIMANSYENIKLDKSILWKLSKNSGDSELLRNLMRFIKSLGSDIVQEGVETKEQLDFAISCGADYIQGYFFSKPIEKDQFFNYLDIEKKRL